MHATGSGNDPIWQHKILKVVLVKCDVMSSMNQTVKAWHNNNTQIFKTDERFWNWT